MEERVGLSGDKLEDAFDDLLYGVRSVSSSVEGVLSHFDKRNIRFRSDRDMNRFVELYSKFSNTTRMPCNRGYTPDEMMQMTPPEERFKSLSLGPNIRKSLQTGEMDIEDFRKQILTMELPSEALRFDLLKQLADINPPLPSRRSRRRSGATIPVLVAAGRNTRGAAENDDPIKTGHSGNRGSK